MTALRIEDEYMGNPNFTDPRRPMALDDDLDDDFDPARLSNDRHPTLDSLCSRLHAIIVGRSAQELLNLIDLDHRALPEEAGLWAAPSWVWLHSRVNVGRKERSASGQRLRLPVRVSWSTNALSIVPIGERVSYDWTAAGLGHTGIGTTLVGSSQTIVDDVIVEQANGMPTEVTVPTMSRHQILRELREMVEMGRRAHWEALEYLEPYITRALTMAHSSVANELSLQWGTHQALLDSTKLESIRDQMLLGDSEHPGKVSQLLDRCLRPETFRKCEPLKYIKESLRRDANEQVRKAIGDPHIGAKIRKVARDVGVTDVDAVVEEYRVRYPKDRLSRERALAALSVAPDPMAGWWGLQAFGRE
jgi:hypothetical protein